MSTPDDTKSANAEGAPAPKEQENAPAKSLKERAAAGEKLTPSQLAELSENIIELRPTVAFGGNEHPTSAYSAFHEGAAQLHGWAAHAHHGKDPLTLTLEDYKKALEAAAKGEAPHEPACADSTVLPKAHQQRIEAAKASKAAAAQKGNK